MNTKNSWVWLPRPYFHHHPQPPPLPSIKQQPNQSNQCNWVSSMANCPLTPPVYALAKLLFSVAVKAAASFSDIALLGLFIFCWQRRPLASTLAASPQQLIRKETGALPCFFPPTILLSCTFPLCELHYQPPGSSDFINWLSASPAAFTASSSKSPHWLRYQENNCMGLPESDFALLNSFQKQISSNLQLTDDLI